MPQRADTIAPITATPISRGTIETATSSGGGGRWPATILLVVAALVVLAALVPPRAVFALGEPVGAAFIRGRPALAIVGVAVALGVAVAILLGGT